MALQVLTVNKPEYPNIRIFVYRGYKLINLAAPANGIAKIVREKENAPFGAPNTAESKPN